MINSFLLKDEKAILGLYIMLNISIAIITMHIDFQLFNEFPYLFSEFSKLLVF